MRSASRYSLIAGALLSASGHPLLPADPIPREPGKPIVKNRERLTKAEKKRVRKSAQRAKLAARSTEYSQQEVECKGCSGPCGQCSTGESNG